MAQVFRNLILVSIISGGLPAAQAHMEMSWPYTFRSRFDPNITDPDYDNTSPLLSDGSNYPCKGYQDLASSQIPVTSYTPGKTYNLSLVGGATHGGGSCQISLSYDDGQTFHVIKSMIGGCPLKSNWNFTIPDYASPSQSVILAWTWFNLIGNREMYMQCARASIVGQSVPRYRRLTSKRQTSIDQLPENFVCDIGNGCTTVEDHEVIFPDPGNDIENGTDSDPPMPGPGYTLTPTLTSNVFNSTSTSTVAMSFGTFTPGSYPNSTTTYVAGPTATGTAWSTVLYNTTSMLTMTSGTSSDNTSMPGQFFATYTNVTSTAQITTTTIHANTTSTKSAISQIFDTTSTTTASAQAFDTSSTISTSQAFDTTSTTSDTTSTASDTTSTTSAATEGVDVTSTTLATTQTTVVTSSITAVSAASASATVAPSSCTPGEFTCISPASFSQCVSDEDGSTSYVFMGQVAAGMQCIDGSIIRQNDAPCTPDGSLQCEGSQSFYLCTNGGLIDMGPVALGTVCSNGMVVAT